MDDNNNNLYTPLQLEKLCCNVIVEKFYNKDEYLFIKNIKILDLPDILNKNILDRYRVIKHILNHS
tara:strand:+ start:927 stop:1124 length:198 start_codon:yes stop_codon:yes gene_type:complete